MPARRARAARVAAFSVLVDVARVCLVLVDKRALASSTVRDWVVAGCRRVVSSLRWQRPSASCYRREVARCADVEVSVPEKLVSRTRATAATIANSSLFAQAVTTWWLQAVRCTRDSCTRARQVHVSLREEGAKLEGTVA